MLFAPDARALLSDEFAADHCFRVVSDPRAPELIGLRFTPVPAREVVDIAGIFWMDRESGLLRRVQYRYHNGGEAMDAAEAGGSLTFGAVGDSVYGITAWEVRSPVYATRVVRTDRGLDRRPVAGGARIEGATIALAPAAEPVATDASGRVFGRIEDASQRTGGLGGARVTVIGTGRATRTADDGRFELPRVPAGSAIVRIDHERLRLFGVDSRREVEVPPDGAVQLVLTLPTGPEAYAAVCPHSMGADGRAAMVGRVLDAELEVGVANAAMLAAWRGRLIPSFVRAGAERVTTNEIGHFAICDLNTETRVNVTVVSRGYRQAKFSTTLRPGSVSERTVRLFACRPEDAPTVCPEP
jgi:hypothetical protein